MIWPIRTEIRANIFRVRGNSGSRSIQIRQVTPYALEQFCVFLFPCVYTCISDQALRRTQNPAGIILLKELTAELWREVRKPARGRQPETRNGRNSLLPFGRREGEEMPSPEPQKSWDLRWGAGNRCCERDEATAKTMTLRKKRGEKKYCYLSLLASHWPNPT